MAAVQLAIQFLQSDAVKEQIQRAPKALTEWAAERRRQRPEGRGRSSGSLARLNPAGRFGQRGLERRVDNMAGAVALAFGDREHALRPELWDALDEVQRAIAIAGKLPTLKRKRMHLRIDNELDALELGLIEAVLPKG